MNRKAARCAGFTLIEVMVALLIVAVALPALMFQLGTQLDGSSDIEARTVAGWVAQEVLTLRQLEIARDGGGAGYTRGESEMANRRWLWQLTEEPTPVPGLLRLTVDVAVDSEPAETLNSLTVYLAPDHHRPVIRSEDE